MKKYRWREQIINGIVILLSLVALWLAANAPSSYQNLEAVYQGF